MLVVGAEGRGNGDSQLKAHGKAVVAEPCWAGWLAVGSTS